MLCQHSWSALTSRGVYLAPSPSSSTARRWCLFRRPGRGTALSVLLRRRLRARPAVSRNEHHRVSDFLETLRASAPAEWVVVKPDIVVDTLESLLVDQNEDPLLPQQLAAFRRDWPSVELPVMAGHGDLSPGNILMHDDRANVID
jgi:hypothetical protein